MDSEDRQNSDDGSDISIDDSEISFGNVSYPNVNYINDTDGEDEDFQVIVLRDLEYAVEEAPEAVLVEQAPDTGSDQNESGQGSPEPEENRSVHLSHHDTDVFNEPLSMHSLMERNMVSVSGQTLLFEREEYRNIPVIVQELVLLPEQYLPVTTAMPEIKSALRKAIADNHIFGVRSASSENIGTIAQILKYKDTENSAPFDYHIKLLAKGTGRFKIRSSRKRSHFFEWANIEALPEIRLPGLTHRKFFHDEESCHRCDQLRDPSEHTWVGKSDDSNFLLTSHYKQPLTVWPKWVYRQYDADLLVERVKTLVSNLMPDLKGIVPSDPTTLSFWVAQNFPFEDSHKLALLKVNSPIQRLRAELLVIGQYDTLVCRECEEPIGSIQDVFCMAVEGPSGTYVNAHGFIHETLTIYKAKGYLSSNASVEHSWFPGWAWAIMNCNKCRRHLGWKFTATKRNLKPRKFWGLTRRSLGISHGDKPEMPLVY